MTLHQEKNGRHLVSYSRTGIALLLTSLLVLGLSLDGQTKPSPPIPRLPPEKLNIFILEGQKASNFIPDHRGTSPVVEVRDEAQLPIEGASVTFTLPSSGAGGYFANSTSTTTVTTDVSGQATAPFAVNDTPGPFDIQVDVKMGDRTATTIIHQTNSLVIPKAKEKGAAHWYSNRKILIIIGAAAVAGVVLAVTLRGGSSSSPTSSAPTVIITPGNPTVGAPH